jgi:hypothetical protein
MCHARAAEGLLPCELQLRRPRFDNRPYPKKLVTLFPQPIRTYIPARSGQPLPRDRGKLELIPRGNPGKRKEPRDCLGQTFFFCSLKREIIAGFAIEAENLPTSRPIFPRRLRSCEPAKDREREKRCRLQKVRVSTRDPHHPAFERDMDGGRTRSQKRENRS